MPTISEIYDRFPVTPQLQLHQLRVAAVANQIVDGFDAPLDHDGIVRACLIHDMGNLVKFELERFPQFLEPGTLPKWQKAQAAMKAKYGSDEHAATVDIARELGASDALMGYIAVIGYRNTISALNNPHYEGKICHYADHRVTPDGVTSLDARLADGKRRYSNRTDRPLSAREVAEKLDQASRDIETQIFQHLKFEPSEITNESIAPYLDKLSHFIW